MLPTFIVIGAQKAGTSSLWRYLDAHPDVFVAAEKEPKFFVGERGATLGLEWYESLFAPAGAAKARGELSTDYTIFPLYAGVPERMAALVPDVRLIYVMRHPIERMRSAYEYALHLGEETRPIDDALLLDARYAYQSLYAFQIEQYLEHFSLSQMLLVTAEDLRHRRAETLARVFSFIGADPDWVPENLEVEYNAAQGRTKPKAWARRLGEVMIRTHLGERLPTRMLPYVARASEHPFTREQIAPEACDISPELFQKLAAYLRNDVAALRGLMGPQFDAWGLLQDEPVG